MHIASAAVVTVQTGKCIIFECSLSGPGRAPAEHVLRNVHCLLYRRTANWPEVWPLSCGWELSCCLLFTYTNVTLPLGVKLGLSH